MECCHCISEQRRNERIGGVQWGDGAVTVEVSREEMKGAESGVGGEGEMLW